MKNKDKVCVEKIIMYCNKVISFSDEVSREDFMDSDILKYSCSFALGQIGDLVKQISNNFKEQRSEVPWHKVAGFRNRVIHEYENVDLDILWEIITKSIPELLNYTQEILNDIKQEETQ